MKLAIISRVNVAFSCLVLVLFLLAHVWPVSWWLHIENLRVDDAKQGEPIRMYVDRKIQRPFSATWSATVRAVSDGKEHLTCSTSALSDYKPAAKLPAKLSLGWWTNNKCATLPPGAYVLTTTWLIHTGALVPDKTLTLTSNIFTVTE